MANAVRKICTKISNGHQYLLGTAKTSAYSGHLVSDTVYQQSPGSQVEKRCRLNYADNLFSQPQSLYNVGQSVDNKLSVAAAVEWFNRPNRQTNTEHSVSSLSNLYSIEPKPDGSPKSISGNNNDTSNPRGLPSAEQLENMQNELGETLPTMFRQNLNYSLFHPKLVFENNIRGTKTVGLQFFMSTISMLRLVGHLKYAFVKFDILKITKHPDDGTIKVRWRIKGISGMKVFLKFWKFRLWNFDQVIKENVESWHDGFSIFFIGSDGLVHRLTADKMQPDNDPVIEVKNPLAGKLALFLGLSPQLNNLDCLMTYDSEQTNELLKMVMMSLEDVF